MNRRDFVRAGAFFIDSASRLFGAEWPERVVSSGGRYFQPADQDWEWPDTQTVSMEFPGGKLITWEGTSCAIWSREYAKDWPRICDAVRADITEWAIIEPVSSDSLDTVHASLEALRKVVFP